ncbi:unnamed protein product [Phaeothamnion confervicola]
MALSATIHVFEIELADSDRGVFQPLELRVARHPSETADFLLTRVLAYCLEYCEGIAFSRGISDTDEPTLAVRDLTGALLAWIDVGSPEAARLHKAGKAAPRVAVYTHKDPDQWIARLASERIHRVEQLEIHSINREWLAALTKKLSRRMAFTLTVSERHIYLSMGEETTSTVVERHGVPH